MFDKAVDGLSWYEYSRHASSVLVYYMRSYDHILQRLDERELLDTLTLGQLVDFTNTLYDEWPLREQHRGTGNPLSTDSGRMNSLDILSANIPLAERMMYIALDTRFLKDRFPIQLRLARDHVKKKVKNSDLRSELLP